MQNLLKIFEENDKARQHLERAEKRFGPKSFYEQYRPLQVTANIGRLSLPLFSLATGCFALAATFGSYLPLWAALALAVLLLALWERVKALSITKSCELFYLKSAGFPAGLLVVATLFSVGSAYFSMEGAGQLARQMDTTEQDVASLYRSKSDSLVSIFDNRIEKAKEAAAAYYEANKVGGQLRWTRGNTIAEHHRQLSERVVQLETEKGEALRLLSADERQALTDGRQDYRQLTLNMLWITAAVELLIILANWFSVYFDYRVYRENELIRAATNRQVMLNPEQVREFFTAHIWPKLYQLPAASGSPGQSSGRPSTIGFRAGRADEGGSSSAASSEQEKSLIHQENKAQNLSSAASSNSSSAASSEQELIAAIKAGDRDYRTLTRRFKVNVSRLHELIKQYGK